MSIKDKIESLPSGYAIPAMESYKRFSNLSVSDLKALSDSHTALLELLKNRGNDYTMEKRISIEPRDLEGITIVETGERLVDLFPNGLIVDFKNGEIVEVRHGQKTLQRPSNEQEEGSK